MPDEPKAEERRAFSQEQYDMLRRCSDAGDMTEWNEWRKASRRAEIEIEGAFLVRANLSGADLVGANLGGAILSGANLSGADLSGANLSGADLAHANLGGADLTEANLSGAGLGGANLSGADLVSANLSGSNFADAIVDGGTHLRDNVLDRRTDFEGVGLEAARVEPGLKQLLKYNVRRKRWRRWYRDNRVAAPFARLLWFASDYGRSTQRILLFFAGFALLFATIFSSCRKCIVTHDGRRIEDFCHALSSSVVTMTTLGFGEVHADRDSRIGQFLLATEVLIGYVLLAALITRLAILFQAEGPAARFADERTTGEHLRNACRWLARAWKRGLPYWRYRRLF